MSPRLAKIAGKFNSKDARGILVSLLLAAGIWFIFNLSIEYSGIVGVDVVAESNISGHAQQSSNSVTVLARVREEGFRLLRDQRRNHKTKIKIDAQDLKKVGEDVFVLSGSAINSYSGQIFENVIIEAMISDSLRFVFASVDHKKVPVEMVKSLSFKEEYMPIGKALIEPDSVTIYGNPSRLENIDRVYTESLNKSNVSENINGHLKINSIRGIRMSDSEVTYSIGVSRFIEMKTTVEVKEKNNPAGHHLQTIPSSAEITVRCAFPPVNSRMTDIDVFIDWEDFAQSLSGRCIARTGELPAGVFSCSIEPEIFYCIEKE